MINVLIINFNFFVHINYSVIANHPPSNYQNYLESKYVQ